MNDEHSARRALANIPGFAPEDIASARFTRLKGLTNTVFKVEVQGRTLCLRLPGEETAAIIDRRAEELSARAAASAGVAPEVLFFDANGVMLTPFIDAVTLSPAGFRERTGAVERAGQALRLLHDRAPAFAREFRVFDIVENYLALLEPGREKLLENVRLLLAAFADVREALAARPEPLRPCHCDPTGANLLDTGERVVIIDWEYSGMNNAAWDLAYLSLEGSFDEAQDDRLQRAYFGRLPTAAESGRMAIHKPLCQLLAATWALIQDANGNPAADFRAYADRTLESCGARLRSPDFVVSIEAVHRDRSR